MAKISIFTRREPMATVLTVSEEVEHGERTTVLRVRPSDAERFARAILGGGEAKADGVLKRAPRLAPGPKIGRALDRGGL